MSIPTVPARPSSSRPRRVHMVLRDGAELDGKLFLTEGQTLALYLGSRKGGWVNIVDIVWGHGERVPHMVLQVDHLAFAASVDGDIPAVVGSALAAQRWVQIGLENQVRLQGCLFLAERQRLSDYLHTVGKFLPIVKTKRASDGRELGDVALNCASIKLVRDISVPAQSELEQPADEPYSTFIINDTPVTRQSVRTDAASMTLITPGRIPDRRAGESSPRASIAARTLEAEVIPLTPQQQAGLQRAERHWLGQLAARRGLAAPDGHRLSANPSVGEIWRAVCGANEMAEEELAVLVGAEFKLPVAAFESIDAKAVACIPGKIARRLSTLPVSVDATSLAVATADPLDPTLEQQLRFVTKLRIDVQVAPPTVIAHALEWWYPEGNGG